ncbi:14387_t:CDS:10 [Funneliformis mosseae]|uniref:14387_t:CDS:1 n=1 Tax=Funneliformis mosseae TaxID=27381 RepID=A0A9N8Z2H7_FUNMO|nr:14387_t:CDS:10 [Funneliformis mosseae]
MQMEYEIFEKSGSSEELEEDTYVKNSSQLSHFMHANEFFEALNNLLKPVSSKEDPSVEEDIEHERILRKAISFIEPFQEQPYLLDPHLEAMNVVLSKNISYTDNKNGEFIIIPNKIQRFFRLMYYIMKIRGFKTIVSDLEPTFYFLVALDPKSYETWETRYVLLIWLSLICIIPFDLKTVDSRVSGDESNKFPLVDHMIDLSKFYLKATGKERDGAAVLLSRLLTRRDIAEAYLKDYVQWAVIEVRNVKDVFTITGILTSLCAIYKLGQRQTLLPTLEQAWPCLFLLEENETFSNNALVRKMLVKLAQRFGMCYLKPKVASWRYQRGNRTLKDNLKVSSNNTTGINPSNIHQSLKEDGEEEGEIPEQIEEIIEILLNGLRNNHTVVRWSAAKGIGRLSMRLPQELSDDVIGSLFELFSENTYTRNGVLEVSAVSDNTWHGVCLAVAELARRGLLLPERLSEVIPWISKALKFDLKRGAHSIGAHVRDAACYVCWSFARAYAPEILTPYVSELANSLVVVSVFDREVNVRRASSAAFQENVGRQGIFPHGIDIVTSADYFTVGNKVNAFLEISVKIAEFEEYRYHLIDHLSTITISNWDKTMRELGSKALHNLTRLDLDYMINKVLPSLIPQALSPDMHTRHGALLSIGEICLAWSNIQGNHKGWIEEYNSLVSQISNIIGLLPKHVFTDFGSEITIQAAAHYIACLAKGGWPINEDILEKWKFVVYDLLGRKDEFGQEIAANANAYARRGFSLALGVIRFNNKDVENYLEIVIDALILSATIQETKIWNDAETRRNSILSLTKIFKNLGESFKTVGNERMFEKIINAYFMGLEDYNTDSRGDIGSWIREASMIGFFEIIPLIIKLDSISTNKQWWKTELNARIFNNILKQSVERIDRVRSCAGRILLELLYMKKEEGDCWVIEIPGRDVLQKVLPKDEEIHWISPSELYPRMVKLLVIPEYRFDLLTGLVLSAGGISESLVRYSSSKLLEYASTLPIDSSTVSSSELNVSLTEFAKSLLDIAQHFQKQDRIIIPLFEVIDLLFEACTLQKITNEKQFLDLFECVKKEVTKCKDIRKLTACMKVFCGMISLSGTVRNKALYQLLSLLVHPFPKIRRSTAEQLYLTLTGSVEEETEESLEIEEILTNTDCCSLSIS